MKSWVKCSCGKSDGNDDKTINKEIISLDNISCDIIITKQCDICGKEYKILRTYDVKYVFYLLSIS